MRPSNDLGSIGRPTTLHVLRREPGVRRAAAFAPGAEVRAVCGRVGELTHLELGVDGDAVRVRSRVVCVTCVDLLARATAAVEETLSPFNDDYAGGARGRELAVERELNRQLELVPSGDPSSVPQDDDDGGIR